MIMAYISKLGLMVALVEAVRASSIPVSGTPVNASAPIPEAFVSFSIEFAYFPDFAGKFSIH